MLLILRQTTTNMCSICQGRSTWDFLHDFYLRVANTENRNRQLEADHQACRLALSNAQNALDVERKRHEFCFQRYEQETTARKEIETMYRCTEQALKQSGQIIDELEKERNPIPNDFSNGSRLPPSAELLFELHIAQSRIELLQSGTGNSNIGAGLIKALEDKAAIQRRLFRSDFQRRRAQESCDQLKTKLLRLQETIDQSKKAIKIRRLGPGAGPQIIDIPGPGHVVDGDGDTDADADADGEPEGTLASPILGAEQ